MGTNIFLNGLDNLHNPIETLRIVVINTIVILASPIIFFYCIAFFLKEDYLPGWFFLFSLFILGTTYLLVRIGKSPIAKMCILTYSAFVVFTSLIYFGRAGDTEIFLPILFTLTFLFFDSLKVRILFGVALLSLYLFSYTYLEEFGPISIYKASEFDAYLNMVSAMIFCGLLSYYILLKLTEYLKLNEKNFNELSTKTTTIESQNRELALFTSAAAHDLKTPVRTIINFLGLLKLHGLVDDTKGLEYLNTAVEGARHMDSLISGISSYQEFNTYDLKPKDSSISSDLNKILEAVILKINPEANPNIVISYDRLPILKINENCLYRIIYQVINNAIKYNESAVKKIIITSTIEEGQMLLNFADNGLGVEPDYLTYIFEPFKRLHTQDVYPGAGLGLAICKKILATYNAEIYAKNIKSGSVFVIKFDKALVIN